jgi:hypothetical protein
MIWIIGALLLIATTSCLGEAVYEKDFPDDSIGYFIGLLAVFVLACLVF